MIPSTQALDRAFPGKGRALRALLSSADAVYAHPAVIELQSKCHHAPTLAHCRMTALDAVAETYGIEHVHQGHNARSLAFDYLNTGDTYALTLVRYSDGRYRVASIGDIVERGLL